jgi:hypothetical protein
MLTIGIEKNHLSDYGKLSRKDYRRAKTDSLKKETTNFIDGYYVEDFIECSLKQ